MKSQTNTQIILQRNAFPALVILFLIAVAFVSFHFTNLYQSTITVRILSRERIAGLLNESVARDPGNMMASQLRVITSFPVLSQTALGLGLIDEQTTTQEKEKVLHQIRQRIKTEIVGTTNIIKITALDRSSKKAMRLAETVAQTYMKIEEIEKRKHYKASQKYIEEELERVEAKLQTAEREITSSKLFGQYLDKLHELQFQLALVMPRYTDKHPLVRQLKGQISALQNKLKDCRQKGRVNMASQRKLETNQNIYVMLRRKLEETRISEAEKISEVSILNPAFLPRFPISPKKRMQVFISRLKNSPRTL